MKNELIKIQIMFVLALFMLLPFSVLSANADAIPVNPVNGELTTFDPTIQDNSSLYMVPSDFNGTCVFRE